MELFQKLNQLLKAWLCFGFNKIKIIGNPNPENIENYNDCSHLTVIYIFKETRILFDPMFTFNLFIEFCVWLLVFCLLESLIFWLTKHLQFNHCSITFSLFFFKKKCLILLVFLRQNFEVSKLFEKYNQWTLLSFPKIHINTSKIERIWLTCWRWRIDSTEVESDIAVMRSENNTSMQNVHIKVVEPNFVLNERIVTMVI